MKENKCGICRKIFDRQANLIRHESIHLKNPLLCKTCKKTSKRIDHFKNHNCNDANTKESKQLIVQYWMKYGHVLN